MDEHDEQEQEPQEIPVTDPQPSPIFYHENGTAEEETDLVQEWLTKAKEEGVINDDEEVRVSNIRAVIRCAKRNDMIPSDMTTQEATVLFTWWWAFSAGYGYHEYRQRAVMAQAIQGIGAHMMESLGIDFPEQEEEEGEGGEDVPD